MSSTGYFNVNYVVEDMDSNVIAVVEDNQIQEVDVEGTIYTIDATDGSRTYVYLGEEEIGNIRKSKASALELEGARVVQEYGNFENTGETKAIKVFEKWGDVGFLNYMFEGLVTGDKWGSAVGVVAFILVVGGAFGIILRTGSVDASIINLITKFSKADLVLIPLLFFVFSLGGAIFGMGEEAIPFATSWMNPFSVAIAQGIAGIQVGSGATFRIVMWVVFQVLSVLSLDSMA